MMKLSDIKKVYFIGVGGIGMSALVRFFHERGVSVCGYDKTPTALTRKLEEEGIRIHYTDDVSLIPKDVELVVYTPAIPADHKELNFYLENQYPVVKRSDVLQIVTQDTFNVCVAGTHGKTTISTMVAHLLRHSAYGCNAFLGGISVNYDSNYWSSEREVSVVEADEFDRSFLKLSPDIAIVSSMDPDHLDIYGNATAMEEAFIDFTHGIKKSGKLIYKHGLMRGGDLHAAEKYTYSLKDTQAHIFTTRLQVKNGGYDFDIQLPDRKIENLELKVGGLHNVENMLAAIAAVAMMGLSSEKIRSAVAAYRGVKRRFEYVLREAKEGVIFIDDYAHHPAELDALISGARDLYPNRPLTIAFQPHLFSRTRDFADAFAASLDKADEVLLLPIYPAREQPIAGVSSDLILGKMKNAKKHLLSKDELVSWCKENKPSLFITAGAGDIDALRFDIQSNLTT